MKSHRNNKVIIGLSGGVDSAVAAYLLKKRGYDISAVYLQCWKEPGCRADVDREDALKVALTLNLPFQVLDFSADYKEKILNYFYDEYKAGRTPNPDILCNSVIKFGLFYDWAMEQGYDYVATGHYAKKVSGDSLQLTAFSPATCNLRPATYLAIPKDTHKDQTYFLYQIPQERLAHVLFPLGNYLKSEVREIAREQNLPVAEKKDSMGICFVGDINVPQFLKQKFRVKKGEVQLADGTVVGEHEGYYLFTIGKRGTWKWKVKSQKSKVKIGEHFDLTNLPKLYVIAIRPKENVVVVGEREEAERQQFEIRNLKFEMNNLMINDQKIKPSFFKEGTQPKAREEILQRNLDNIFVRIRNTGNLLPAKLTQLDEKTWKVHLEKPEFGVSPGQSCVVYLSPKTYHLKPETIVVGGGVIG